MKELEINLKQLKKIKSVTNRLGKQAGELGVKLFHKSINIEEAKKIQFNNCKGIVRHYGKLFAGSVYKNVYVIMTNINLQRQHLGNRPIPFFTDGMDEFFHKLEIEPYDKNS